MFGFGKRGGTANRLKERLEGYPPWAPPHRGFGSKYGGEPVFSLSDARENLTSYRTVMPDRLAALNPVLVDLGLDPPMAYTDAAEFVRQLHPLLLIELPTLYKPSLAKRDAWALSDRAGDAIVLSLLGDLAMLSADILLRANPGSFVGLDLDPKDVAMFSYRRPCLLGLADTLFPDSPPDIFHLEEEWFGYYANMDDPTRLASPSFRDGIWMDVIGGRIPELLERYATHPNLAELKQSTWMRDAA